MTDHRLSREFFRFHAAHRAALPTSAKDFWLSADELERVRQAWRDGRDAYRAQIANADNPFSAHGLAIEQMAWANAWLWERDCDGLARRWGRGERRRGEAEFVADTTTPTCELFTPAYRRKGNEKHQPRDRASQKGATRCLARTAPLDGNQGQQSVAQGYFEVLP